MDTDLETALDRSNVSQSEEAVYTIPVADVGEYNEISIVTGQEVTLDGSNSSDNDNDLLTFKWTIITKPAGSIATINNDTGMTTTFTPDITGDYEIELTVNDGIETDTDSITIKVVDANPDDPEDREGQGDDLDSIDTCFISLL